MEQNKKSQLYYLLGQLNDHLIEINSIIFQMKSVLNQIDTPEPKLNNYINNMKSIMSEIKLGNKRDLNLNLSFDKIDKIENSYCLSTGLKTFFFQNNLGGAYTITKRNSATVEDLLNEYMSRFPNGHKVKYFLYNTTKLEFNDKRRIENVFYIKTNRIVVIY